MSARPRGSRSLLGLVRRVRGHLRRRAGTAIGAGAAFALGAVLILAWLLAGSEGWTPGTAAPLGLLILGSAAFLAFAVWTSARLRRWTDEERMAEEIERSFRLPEGSVRAQVELCRTVPPGVSGMLAKAGEAALLKRLPERSDRLSGAPGREVTRVLRWGLAAGSLAVVVASGLFALRPERARAAWAGLATPVALLAPPALPPLRLAPGDQELPRGQVPAVVVTAEGRDSVTVHWQAIGSVPEERRVAVSGGTVETELPPLEVETTYWASSADGGLTPTYSLVPTDPSLFEDVLMEVAYPPHTRLPTEVFRMVPVALRLPEGTVISVAGRVQGQGTAVLLREQQGGVVAARMEIGPEGFSGIFRPARSGQIEWVVEGGQGGGQLQTLDIELVPDAPPTVALPVPGGDTEMPFSLRMPILAEATDEYGVSWIEIESVVRAGGRSEAPVVDRIPTGDLPRVTLRPVLDFSTWGLRPGDEVLVRARAADNAPNQRVVETPFYRLVVRDEESVREAARSRIDDAARRAEELLGNLQREAAALRDLERRTRFGSGTQQGRQGDQGTFEERQELLQALERQAELTAQVEALREGLREASRALEEMARGNAYDAELQARIEELEQALEQALGPEAAAQMAELRERLQNGDVESPEQALQQIAELQQDLEARLERALDNLQREAAAESLQGAQAEVEELLRTQEALVEELARGSGEARQREQAEQTGAVSERVAALSDELSRAGDPAASERSASASEQLAEAQQAMTAAADASAASQPAEASNQADQAREALQQALQEMQQAETAMEQEEEEREETWQEALRRAAIDAVALARQQAEVRAALDRTPSERFPELEVVEVALLEGVRNLGRRVAEATADQAEIGRALAAELGRSIASVDRAVGGLRGGGSSRREPEAAADSAQASMHRVAILALEALREGGSGEGAGSQDQGEALSSLSQQQQQLNQAASNLAQATNSGGAPSQMEMQNLVRGQSGVGAALQEMANQPGPGGMRGTLDALAEESRAITDELRGGRLDAETLARQDRFLQRLLEAGRTLEQDGPTDEREATSAEDVGRRAVTALPDDLLDPLGFTLPTPEELGALTPGQRRLVLDYFDRVNRRRASEGPR
jgi:hypothetical protein